jgi:hypothetical protein
MGSIKALTAALLCLPLLLGACGSDDDSASIVTSDTTESPDGAAGEVPDREPDLLGTITGVDAAAGQERGVLGTILVEGDPAPERGRKISYTVTSNTTITGGAGGSEVHAFDDLVEGQLADTWAAGPCAESYPEQCTLEAIRVAG